MAGDPADVGGGPGDLTVAVVVDQGLQQFGQFTNQIEYQDVGSAINNDYIAMVMGMLVCAAAGAIILPPNSRW